MGRVVIDTNVLVSGIIQRSGFPYKIVRAWEEGTLALVTSVPMVEEAAKVLNYPKIRKKYGLADTAISQIIANFLRYSILVDLGPELAVVKDDPEDNKVLATAVSGEAEYIVTGDSHLLALRAHGDTRIATPKDFCELVRL